MLIILYEKNALQIRAKEKTSPVYRAQLEHITNFPSSQLPDALCVTMKRSEHDLSRWGVCHTSLIHFNKVYFGTIISHCVSEESFIKESVDLISLFLLEIMILLLLGNAHAQKFFFCSIVSSLAAFWRVFFFVSWGPRRFTCSNMSGLNGREIYVDGKNPKLMHTWCAFYYDLTVFGAT